MQNKGAIQLVAICLALVCLYQLSFTFVTNRVENKAATYANGNEKAERFYLDSVAEKTVYNLLGIKYTYKECKELELNLGLDLRGGMNVTMEVDVVDVVKGLANNSADPAFNQAIAEALQMRVTDSDRDFVTSFGEAFERIAPGAQLASPAIFGTHELRDKIKIGTTNREVLDIIRKEADGAIDNTFNILRTRIDRFGVAQPNIRKSETSGRIIIELPGVKDAQRVRELLQGTAALEFFETYDNTEFYQYLASANTVIHDMDEAKKGVEEAAPAQKEKKAEGNELLEEVAEGGEAEDLAAFTANNPLFALLQPNASQQGLGRGSIIGYAQLRDTAKINTMLAIPQVKALFPRPSRLMWEMEPENGVIALHAIRITTSNGKAPLEGDAIVRADADFDQMGRPVVTMSMNGEGSKSWARLTKANIGKCIAVVLDGAVASAPNVNTEITGGRSEISGNFTVEQTEDLANILKSGKLPAPAHIIADEVVGPSLGRESITSGLWSFVIAFILVLVYMIFFYSFGAGTAANIALLANFFFLIGILTSIGAVLTLPGIAGIVLTLGMAVDANVLIFERIEEKMREGKGINLAVKEGYRGSAPAIIDGNVTTLLTGIILYYFGQGPVKGFATTLIIGIITSLFTSIFISRLVVEARIKRHSFHFTTKTTSNWLRNPGFNFIKGSKTSFIVSGIIILLGLGSLFIKGMDYGIDFVGGRSYTVYLDQDVRVDAVADDLAVQFGSLPEVTTFGSNNQIRITTKYKIEESGAEVDQEVTTLLYKGLEKYLPEGRTFEEFADTQHELRSSQKIGAAVAEDMTRSAIWSVIAALVVIFLYILIRFSKWQYSLGAVVGLVHNVLIVIGVYSIFSGILPFSMEVNQSFIAAVLTVVGYSINDTVVIFDRIREYQRLFPKRPLLDTVNSALNSTLRRTFSTSLSTLVVLIAIFAFGGASIRGFIFALLIGVIIGTYSSILIASPLAYHLSKKAEAAKLKAAK